MTLKNLHGQPQHPHPTPTPPHHHHHHHTHQKCLNRPLEATGNYLNQWWHIWIFVYVSLGDRDLWTSSGIILCMHPANEIWRYNVTSSLIGWGHTEIIPASCSPVQTHNRGANSQQGRSVSCWPRAKWYQSHLIQACFNPLRAKFFRGNINIYLHLVSFLHIDTTQVVEILPQVGQEPTSST